MSFTAHSFLSRGWPALAGFACLLVGLAMLGGSAFFNQRAHQLADLAQAAPQAGAIADTPLAHNTALQIPTYATHLDDMSLLFRLAKDQGVTIGPVNYRSETSRSSPLVMRLVELRVDEEYPKLKGFVAELLRKVPHAYLDEISVEQAGTSAGTSAGKVRAMLKLSFAYQSAGSAYEQRK